MKHRFPLVLALAVGFLLQAAEEPDKWMRLRFDDYEALKLKDGQKIQAGLNVYQVIMTSYHRGITKEMKSIPHRVGIHYELAGGKIISETTYGLGTREGPYKKYTLFNGKTVLETEGEYFRGKKWGKWKRYDRGLLLQEMTYEHGKLEGEFTEYRLHGDLAGKPARVKTYANGRLHGETRIYSSNTGNLIQRIFYRDGMVMRRIWYDENSGLKLRESSFD